MELVGASAITLCVCAGVGVGLLALGIFIFRGFFNPGHGSSGTDGSINSESSGFSFWEGSDSDGNDGGDSGGDSGGDGGGGGE